MIYLDTSFITPMILEEATSRDVEACLTALEPGTIAISHWTRVEFASLLAREVRMGGLDSAAAPLAEAEFDALVAASLHVFSPDPADFNLAKRYLRHHETGLRAGDALHLAIAFNRDAEAIFSLDRRLVSAGIRLGLPTQTGIAVED